MPKPPEAEKPKDPDVTAAAGTDAGITQETRDKLGKAPAPVRDLLKGLVGSGAKARRLNDAQLQRYLGLTARGLTADQVAKLLETRRSVEGETADQIPARTRRPGRNVDRRAMMIRS